MTGNLKGSYIEYRMKKAEESLRDALFLLKKAAGMQQLTDCIIHIFTQS